MNKLTYFTVTKPSCNVQSTTFTTNLDSKNVRLHGSHLLDDILKIKMLNDWRLKQVDLCLKISSGVGFE